MDGIPQEREERKTKTSSTITSLKFYLLLLPNVFLTPVSEIPKKPNTHQVPTKIYYFNIALPKLEFI